MGMFIIIQSGRKLKKEYAKEKIRRREVELWS